MLSKYVSSTENPLRSDLYILGVCYFNKGNYSNAVNALSRTVRQNDELTQNAYLYLGQSYLKLGDKNNARMAFEAAATSSFDKQIKEVAMYNYALLIHETAFTGFGESVTIFEDFLNDFPNSQYADKVNDYLVEVYLATKNYEAALKSINKIKHPSTKILEAKQDILSNSEHRLLPMSSWMTPLVCSARQSSSVLIIWKPATTPISGVANPTTAWENMKTRYRTIARI